MVVPIVFIVAGVALLAVAPDRFVAGSAGLADHWGMSRVLIGAIVIGIGTSAPELLVSGLAAGRGEAEVGIGNIIGSNMANLALVIPAAALIRRLTVAKGLVRVELPILAAATVLFAVLVQGGLSRVDGLLLVVALVVTLVVIVTRSTGDATPDIDLDADVGGYLAAGEHDGVARRRLARLALLALGGLVGTVAGAQLLVSGAIDIAEEFGISSGFVGLSLVAIGTSLPELATAIAAARAGEMQLVLGNVVGSNLFNALAVGGLVGLVGPASLDDRQLTVWGVLAMLAITAAAIVAISTERAVSRREACVLLAGYLAVMPFLV